jgi:hypothetical protein
MTGPRGRCTPRERIESESTDPCFCPFRDCVAEAAERGDRCIDMCYGWFNDSGDIIGNYLCVEDCNKLLNMDLQACQEAYERCAHKPITPPPAPRPWKTQDMKDRSAHSANNWTLAGVGFGCAATAAGLLLGGFPLAAGVTAIWLGAAAGFSGFEVWDFTNMAIDPPDPNFDTISQPEPPTPPVISPNAEVSASLATALNAVLTNMAQSVGLGRAVVIAMEKASGAEEANDSQARDRQLTAEREFAGEWASVIERAAPLRRRAATRLEDAFGRPSLSMTEAFNLRHEILASGWPVPMVDFLHQYGDQAGMSRRDQQDFLTAITIRLADVSLLTTTLPDVVAARVLNASERRVVVALREFAAQ